MRHRPTGRGGTEARRHLRAATIAAVLIAAVAYAAFAGGLPFGDQFEVKAVFSDANQLKPGDPVRLAGVRIGEVTDVGPGGEVTDVGPGREGEGTSSSVTMRIDDPEGLHTDVSLSIQPRLLFEGNFYVAVDPGTPAARPLESGVTIPPSRTDAPVQIDEVLSALTAPAREAIRSSLAEFAAGLDGGAPSGSGFEGLRRATRELDGALVDVREAAGAARGTEPGDTRRALAGMGELTGQLARDPAALAGLVTNFNRVAGALAAEAAPLRSSVRRLDDVLRVAPASLAALDDALPTVTRFAEELRPTLRIAPRSLAQGNRLLTEVTAATRPNELPALVGALEPVTANLPALESQLSDAFDLVGPAARCVSGNVLPTLNQVVPDGLTSSGRPAWQDLLHMAANLTQTSPGFDGNGGTLRISLAESENALNGVLPGIGELIGGGAIQGVRPVWLGAGVEPEFRPDQWCEDQPLPDLDARSRSGIPLGLVSSPAPEIDPDTRQRMTRMASLLTGSKQDRQQLLRMLLGELPVTIGSETGERAPLPTSGLGPSPEPDPGAPSQSPAGPEAPSQAPAGGQGTGPSTQRPGGIISSILDALLGGGGR